MARRSPLELALAATAAVSGNQVIFRKTRSSAIDRVESQPEEAHGLDPKDTERVAWRDRNAAEREFAAAEKAAREASAQAWARAAEARGRTVADPAWQERAEGVTPTDTIVEPQPNEGRDPDERMEADDGDSETVEEIVVDTPPRTIRSSGRRPEEWDVGRTPPRMVRRS